MVGEKIEHSQRTRKEGLTESLRRERVDAREVNKMIR